MTYKTRYCPICTKEIPKFTRAGEKLKRNAYGKRLSCGESACLSAVRLIGKPLVEIETRYCIVPECGKEIPKVSPGGNKIQPARYKEMKCCGKECRQKYLSIICKGKLKKRGTEKPDNYDYFSNKILKRNGDFFLYFIFVTYKVGEHGFVFREEAEKGFLKSEFPLPKFIKLFAKAANKKGAPEGAKEYVKSLRKIKPIRRNKTTYERTMLDTGDMRIWA